MSELTEECFQLFRESYELPTVFNKLAEHGVIEANPCKALCDRIGASGPTKLGADEGVATAGYYGSVLQKFNTAALKHKSYAQVKFHLRKFRNWCGRLLIICRKEYNMPMEDFLEAINEMQELSEIALEWRDTDPGSPDVLVEQAYAFLEFESNAIRISEKQPSAVSEDMAFKRFVEKSLFVSCFLLARDMCDEMKLTFLSQQVEEQLQHLESNIMFYHLEGRRYARDVKRAEHEKARNESIQKVKDVYMNGLGKNLPGTKKLRDYHISTAEELLSWKKLPEIYELWADAQNDILSNGEFSEEEITALLNRMDKDTDSYRTAVGIALRKYPKSSPFHCRALRACIANPRATLRSQLDTFIAADRELKDGDIKELYPIYTIFTRYLMVADLALCEHTFASGCRKRKDLAALLLVPYLEWALLFAGVAKCRALLDRFYMEAAPLKFFEIMINAELNEPKRDFAAARNCFRVAVKYHGETSATTRLHKKIMASEKWLSHFT